MGHSHQPLGTTGYRNADILIQAIVEDGLRASAFVKNLVQIQAIANDETMPEEHRLRQISRICSITLGPKQSHTHVIVENQETPEEEVSAG